MSALIDASLERGFLAACVAVPSWVADAGVLPHQLTSPARSRILGAMLALVARGEPDATSTLAVRTELARKGLAEGCDDELLALTNEITVPADWMPRRLRELATARDARTQALRAVAAYDAGQLEQGAVELRGAIGALDPDVDDQRIVSVGALVEAAAERAKTREDRASQGRPVALPTGLASLDALLGDAPNGEETIAGGWEAGDLVVIGGDTNVGKSSIAMAMAWGAARSDEPVPVGIVQVEDPRDRVGNRALSLASAIPQYRIRAGRMSPSQWTKVSEAVRAAKNVPMYFEFRIGGSIPAVCGAIRRLRREKGCKVIVLDYVQAVEAHEDPRLAMRNILASAKREAQRGDADASVVIALSQFRKRENESEPPKRSDLYESAYIAQKAEHILLMHKTKTGAIEVTLDKTKDGKTGGSFRLVRDPDTGLLVDASEEWGS